MRVGEGEGEAPGASVSKGARNGRHPLSTHTHKHRARILITMVVVVVLGGGGGRGVVILGRRGGEGEMCGACKSILKESVPHSLVCGHSHLSKKGKGISKQ